MKGIRREEPNLPGEPGEVFLEWVESFWGCHLPVGWGDVPDGKQCTVAGSPRGGGAAGEVKGSGRGCRPRQAHIQRALQPKQEESLCETWHLTLEVVKSDNRIFSREVILLDLWRCGLWMLLVHGEINTEIQ